MTVLLEKAVVALTAEELTAIDRSRGAAERGEFATDEDLRRVLTKSPN